MSAVKIEAKNVAFSSGQMKCPLIMKQEEEEAATGTVVCITFKENKISSILYPLKNQIVSVIPVCSLFL